MIEFPFKHPAAKEANQIFLTLDVRSEEDYLKLARRDRYLWDITWFETEVMNGGVDQYFYNSAGGHAAACLEALDAIGAKQSHDLLKQAMDLFPEGQPSADYDVRQKQQHEFTKGRFIDDMIQGEIEFDLYQLMLNYYRSADPDDK